MLFAKLNDLSIGGKGAYGIAASAVERKADLPTYLRITDIFDDGTLNLSELKSVDAPNSDKYILKPNDIVFARTGGSTGRNYFYDGSDGVFVYAGFLIKFSIDPEKVNPKYVKYYCRSKQYNDWVQSFNTGSTRGNINAQTFGNMEIPLPERKQQDYLVSILEPIDEKIKNNKQVNDNLLEQASSIYQAWFEDFILSDGSCPPSWKQGTLAGIADITSGKRPPVKSAEKTDNAIIPIVGAASVMGYTTEANHTDKILVTGRVGTHGVVQRFNSPCWASDNTLVITSAFYEYTFQILQRIDYRAMNRGSTQPLITQGDMNKVPILIPDNETLLKFETLVGQLMKQYQVNLLENDKLAELREALLPRLMSGELDVSDLDI